ncbi:MAG: cupin domain-containing protein [Geminicoccaceae bacterium]
MPSRFATVRQAAAPDTYAPDGSEIRFLGQVAAGSMVHCRLPPGGCSSPVRHRTVEEVWYVLAGAGELWRRQDGHEEIVPLRPGVSATIPLGTDFQFRATAADGLDLVIVTMPPWPGADEAVPASGHWPVPG